MLPSQRGICVVLYSFVCVCVYVCVIAVSFRHSVPFPTDRPRDLHLLGCRRVVALPGDLRISPECHRHISSSSSYHLQAAITQLALDCYSSNCHTIVRVWDKSLGRTYYSPPRSLDDVPPRLLTKRHSEQHRILPHLVRP